MYVRRGGETSCIVATHSDESRERMERYMIQNTDGADGVVRTKMRHDGAFAEQTQENDEGAKQIARRGPSLNTSESQAILIIHWSRVTLRRFAQHCWRQQYTSTRRTHGQRLSNTP